MQAPILLGGGVIGNFWRRTFVSSAVLLKIFTTKKNEIISNISPVALGALKSLTGKVENSGYNFTDSDSNDYQHLKKRIILCPKDVFCLV